MAITAAITAVAQIGSAVVANQQRQKAKGQAGKIEADAASAQAAADAKLKAAHDADIQQQSQAAAVARGAATSPARPSTLISPDLMNASARPSPAAGGGSSQLPAPLAPMQRKTLLGQ